MCTLSWLRTATEYQVFFNRDEQRNRQQAVPPQPITLNSTRVLMPTDPNGGGSWISVNEHGLSLYLLNYYHSAAHPTRNPTELISRGLLLRSLAHHRNINAVQASLISEQLTDYAPFTLAAFDLTNSSASPSGNQQVFQWSGQDLNMFAPATLITSSSVKFDEVSPMRQQKFIDVISAGPQTEGLTSRHLKLHASHQDGKNYQSVCMHRSDAKTVSFSHIAVRKVPQDDNNPITFNYHDGSPCETPLTHTASLAQHDTLFG